MTLLNPFLVKLMKGCPIMMHNGYILPTGDIHHSEATLFVLWRILSTISSMWVRIPDLFGYKKIPLTNCLSKAGRVNVFLLRCLSKFDHGKILEIQVPLSKSGSIVDLFCAGFCWFLIKSRTPFVWQNLIHISYSTCYYKALFC